MSEPQAAEEMETEEREGDHPNGDHSNGVSTPSLVSRSVLGGVLMGLANLVPGISGGTMLVAAGIYPRFIDAVAEVTTLRLRWPSLVVLGSVVTSAFLAILLLAGLVKDLVLTQRWIMYSLFIGLTLGGLPVVWRMAKPVDRRVWQGAVGGFLVMGLLVYLQSQGITSSSGSSFGMLVLAGVAGASAMILPGVSGGYLLLLLGQYVPILSGIDAFKTALEARDLNAAMEPALQVVLPVGIGVGVGVVAVSNLLRWLLQRHGKATLGFLVGLLLGAVLGLWPFQQSVEPVVGETVIKGQLVTEENLADFDPEDYPTAFFTPSMGQGAGALGLVLLGLGVTSLVAHLGRERPARNSLGED